MWPINSRYLRFGRHPSLKMASAQASRREEMGRNDDSKNFTFNLQCSQISIFLLLVRSNILALSDRVKGDALCPARLDSGFRGRDFVGGLATAATKSAMTVMPEVFEVSGGLSGSL